MNTWRKRVDKGRHWLRLEISLFPESHRNSLDKMAKPGASFYSQMIRANPAMLRAQKGGQLPKGKLHENG